MSPRRDATRVVHAGLPAAEQGAPLLPGPTFAAPFHLAGDPASAEYVYGRYGNPTWSRYEEAIGELEGGPAVLFASGAAAVTAVLLTVLRPGDVLVAPSDAYPAVRQIATGHLEPRGVEVRLVPTAGEHLVNTLTGARLLWLETPTNPGLDVCDVRALVAAAREQDTLVALDNTLATPLGQRPLELGADFSVASDTKSMTGHSDLVLGHVAVAEPERADDLREWRRLTGALAGPMETWLAHRSLATLELRLTRQCENALVIAEWLRGRTEVAGVRYPGLPDDPSHAFAARQMTHFGPVLCFALADRVTAERFLTRCELVAEATSFGGIHTSAERRARWGTDEVPEGFIRLSAGCEDAADLIADLDQALGG